MTPKPDNRVHYVNTKGPIEDRSCTDVICCFLFGVCSLGWFILSIIALIFGDPLRLANPVDSQGKICGAVTPLYNLTDKPYLFFFDITRCLSYDAAISGCQTPQICVSECPKRYYSLADYYANPRKTNFDVVRRFCSPDFRENLTSKEDLKKAVRMNMCPMYLVPEIPVLKRCFPVFLAQGNVSDIEDEYEQHQHNVSTCINCDLPDFDKFAASAKAFLTNSLKGLSDFSEKVASDLQRVWWQILIILCVGMLLAFLWMYLLRCLTMITIWATIIMVTVSLCGTTVYTWWHYHTLRVSTNETLSFHVTLDFDEYLRMTNLWLTLAIVSTILLAIILLVIIFLRSRIKLATALIEESSRAVTHMLSALYFPLFPFTLHIFVFGFWLLITVLLSSAGTTHCEISGAPPGSNLTNGVACDCRDTAKILNESYCKFADFQKAPSGLMIGAQIFNLFLMFWMTCFLQGFADVTLAGAFASYYWALRKPQDIPSFPVISSMTRALRYHVGSVAFGSLILALVKLIRVVLEYVDHKLKSYTDNPIADFAMKCLMCCLWCFEKVIKFLTRNAYIMIAVRGKNFCWSAKESFMLIMRNCVRFAVLDGITGFLLFLGKLAITIPLAVFSGYWFTGWFSSRVDIIAQYVNYSLYYPAVPVIVIILATYVIGYSFFGVYEMAVDATFLCFLENAEMNDGTPEKPYFMSKKLMKILDKSNTFSIVETDHGTEGHQLNSKAHK